MKNRIKIKAALFLNLAFYVTAMARDRYGAITVFIAKKIITMDPTFPAATAVAVKGYSEEDCGKFLGGNMYRVMKKVWI